MIKIFLEYGKKIYDRLTSGESTEEQAIQGGIWAGAINVSDRIIQLANVIILARLLSPATFGILGIALVTIKGLRRFSNLGFNAALIQNSNEDVDEYLNTAWVVKITRNVLIAGIAVIAAPYLGDLFNEARAVPIIQAIAVANVFLAVRNPGTVYFKKDLNFHKEFVYQLTGRIAEFIVAVCFALIFQSVWALVAGIFTNNISKVVLSYLIIDYRPRISFRLEYAKEMFDFGKWILIQAVLSFLFFEADDAFVGWYFTASALGLYQLAYRYSNAPATEITQVIRRVAFPAFSKIQEDRKKLRAGFYRVVQLTSIVAFPVAAGIFVVAPDFVDLVLGDQWKPMIPIMQALCVFGASRALIDTYGSLFKSVGRPDYFSYIIALQILLVAVPIIPASNQFGVVGVAYVFVGQIFVMLPLSTYLVLSLIDGELSEFLSLVSYPLFGSIFMSAVVWAVRSRLTTGGTTLFKLGTLVFIGVAMYTICMIVIERGFDFEFISVFRRIKREI